MLHLSSRANPQILRLRRLARDGSAYRRLGQAWIEGEHLCSALRSRGRAAALCAIGEDAWGDAALRDLAGWAGEVLVLPASLYATLSALPSPARIGFVIDLPPAPALQPALPSLVLDRVQDAGNVGSILRSAAAFGVGQVLSLAGTAGLWSPKVLRAGMGAHFGLHLVEGLQEPDLAALDLPLVATGSHAGCLLPVAPLPGACAWVFGHEGQGVSASLLQRCALQVRIPQPGGEESLNVAAAAAVCLYEALRRKNAENRGPGPAAEVGPPEDIGAGPGLDDATRFGRSRGAQ